MDKQQKETITIRIISVTFVVVALAVFKPFGLDAWQWQVFVHLLALWVLGIMACMVTDAILNYIVRMPRSDEHGVSYIIRRNLWFQLINTPLVALFICIYRHFVLNDRVDGNQLSWGNFFETLVIIGFCSFAIGLYWRFKFRSKFLAAELEETKMLNGQLQKLQQAQIQSSSANEGKMESPTRQSDAEQTENAIANHSSQNLGGEVVLTGTTSETVALKISDLLYVEAVGNYVKVCRLCEGMVRSDMLRATSKQMEDELRDYTIIVRCHRAFLVNLGQVERIAYKSGAMQLVMKHSRDIIPVSRSNMAHVKKAIKGV